jgi:hypothetical protein
VGVPALAIWLAKRDRKAASHWGEQPSQQNIMVGAELDMPRILPVEPPAGAVANGAPVEDLSHTHTIGKTDPNA